MHKVLHFTGNPFVDSGIWGLMLWLKKKRPEDINLEEVKEIFKDMADLYTTPEWKKLMYYLFPNNPITNPAFKGKTKEKFIEYLTRLTEEIDEVDNDGSCISCGRRGVVTLAKRNDVPLTGSGTLRNYFSYAQEGADYCPVCILAIQFLPLTLYVCGGKVILISSDSQKVMRTWAKKCHDSIYNQILTRNYQVGVNENYLSAQNALFHIVGEIIIERDKREYMGEKVSIRMYYFTNYGQSADIEIFDLPSNVFSFLVSLKHTNEYKKWFEVVNRGFIGKAQNDDERYKKHKNMVYENLLNNRSIIPYFIGRNQNIYGTWNILKLYLKEVRGMDERKIELIKGLSDKIAQYISSTDKVKRLTNLEMAGSHTEFINVLRLIAKDNIYLKVKEPLISLDDYLEIIYKDNYPYWKEIRDLMLFRIYEQLHDYLIEKKEVKSEEE